MPKDLKTFYGERFLARAKEEGIPDLLDRIGDETVATTGEELLEFMTKKEHPALTMEALF
jgi:acetyl-CoA synthase